MIRVTKSKKIVLFIIIVFVITTLFLGCKNVGLEKGNEEDKNTNKDNEKNKNYSITNSELQKLLPDREDYMWMYEGFAEYGHQMVLKSIVEMDNQIIYSVNGEVADASGGEAQGDFSLELIYKIEKGKLTQIKREERMMDSIFDNLVLIEGPLEEGKEWNQKVEDENGNKYTLKCTIEEIKEEDGAKVYTVLYDDINSDYYERREIKEGIGVVKFNRLYESNEDSFEIGYYLYETGTGYENQLEMSKYLPPLGKRLVYHGLAEYGHSGVLREVSRNNKEAEYEFTGDYEDGSGLGGKFTVSYVFDYIRGTVTEKVTSNIRTGQNRVNSIIPNLVVLKTPIETGNTWTQKVIIDDKEYIVQGRIVNISYKNLSYYIADERENVPVVTVRYTIDGIEEYFNNRYIEERKFQIGKGMIGFSKLMKGQLPISGKELEDSYKVNREIINHMFGYSLSFVE